MTHLLITKEIIGCSILLSCSYNKTKMGWHKRKWNGVSLFSHSFLKFSHDTFILVIFIALSCGKHHHNALGFSSVHFYPFTFSVIQYTSFVFFTLPNKTFSKGLYRIATLPLKKEAVEKQWRKTIMSKCLSSIYSRNMTKLCFQSSKIEMRGWHFNSLPVLLLHYQ